MRDVSSLNSSEAPRTFLKLTFPNSNISNYWTSRQGVLHGTDSGSSRHPLHLLSEPEARPGYLWSLLLLRPPCVSWGVETCSPQWDTIGVDTGSTQASLPSGSAHCESDCVNAGAPQTAGKTLQPSSGGWPCWPTLHSPSTHPSTSWSTSSGGQSSENILEILSSLCSGAGGMEKGSKTFRTDFSLRL